MKEARSKNFILYDSTYVSLYSGKGKTIGTRNRSAFARVQGNFGWCLRELLYFLIIIVTISFVKTHKNIH